MDNRVIYTLKRGDLITNDGLYLEFLTFTSFVRGRPVRGNFRDIINNKAVNVDIYDLRHSYRRINEDDKQYKALRTLYGKV